eukprot:6199202-Pleurochrysis_carterae.AAC.2
MSGLSRLGEGLSAKRSRLAWASRHSYSGAPSCLRACRSATPRCFTRSSSTRTAPGRTCVRSRLAYCLCTCRKHRRHYSPISPRASERADLAVSGGLGVLADFIAFCNGLRHSLLRSITPELEMDVRIFVRESAVQTCIMHTWTRAESYDRSGSTLLSSRSSQAGAEVSAHAACLLVHTRTGRCARARAQGMQSRRD